MGEQADIQHGYILDRDALKILFAIMLSMFCWACIAHAETFVVSSPKGCVKADKSFDSVGDISIGKDWLDYRRSMRICPVKNAAGQVSLYIYTVGLDEATESNPLIFQNGHPWRYDKDPYPADPVPLPVLVDTQYRIIGVLPRQFLGTDPATVTYRFTAYAKGFPRRIEIYVTDPTVTSPGWPYCPPPLLWNAQANKFIEAKGDFYAKCRSQN